VGFADGRRAFEPRSVGDAGGAEDQVRIAVYDLSTGRTSIFKPDRIEMTV
jgi:hypothetical protein